MAKAPSVFVRFSTAVADASGKPFTFLTALGVILVWAVSGPLFRFGEAWQMVVNTGTTIITFLMVFLLQNAQNREGRAIQAKLDELIIASASDNRFVGLERLDDADLRTIAEMLMNQAGTRPDESPCDAEAALAIANLQAGKDAA